jgi:hypothetical protein
MSSSNTINPKPSSIIALLTIYWNIAEDASLKCLVQRITYKNPI